jgi:hypothetical protein
MKHIKTFENFLSEAIDTKYWAEYNSDQTLSGGKKEFAEKSKDFDDTFSLAVSDWNVEADRDNRIKGAQIEKIKKIAQEFFNKEGYITVNIAQAMISQES